MAARECAIFDIDGTLADIGHRLHHVAGGREDWPAFFAAMERDAPNEPIARLARLLAREMAVVIVTGRPEEWRETTAAWLRRHCGMEPARLLMRRSGDFRADHVVKRAMLAEIRREGFEPALVVDDRASVVAMWRKEGLPCLQCAPDEPEGPRRVRGVAPGAVLLTLLVGPSGAGKSTFAAAHYPVRWVVASDDVREDMLGDRHDQGHNGRVFRAIHALAAARLLAGMPAVIDATNIRRRDRLACVGLAPAGTRVRYVVIDRPLERKLETRGHRRHPRGRRPGRCRGRGQEV